MASLNLDIAMHIKYIAEVTIKNRLYSIKRIVIVSLSIVHSQIGVKEFIKNDLLTKAPINILYQIVVNYPYLNYDY